MSIRVRRPEADRLELSQGDFLIVKRYLTAGETRQIWRDSTKPVDLPPDLDGRALASAAGKMELDPIAGSIALIVAYLLDWSFCDVDGRPIPIADQPPAVVRAALDRIDPDAYAEIQTAIAKHQTAVAQAIADEKKTRSLLNASTLTLTSVG